MCKIFEKKTKTKTKVYKMYASRESNPGLSLGKATCYHYTTSDSHLLEVDHEES